MAELIQFVLDRLLLFWPIRRVYDWQLGLVLRAGKIHRSVEPGLVFFCPFLDEVVRHSVREDPLDLQVCTRETLDGKPYSVSAALTYCVVNLRKLYEAAGDHEGVVSKVAAGHLGRYIAQVTSSDLRSADIDATTLRSLNRELRRYGLRVQRFYITDCVQTRAYRHYVDGCEIGVST
jgi:regulator of protease activity HflC (stomatin/prohibitin superfamily)